MRPRSSDRSEQSSLPDGELSINLAGYATDQTQEALDLGRRRDSFDQRRAAYTDFVDDLNSSAVNTWLCFTPYSLVVSGRVHGLEQAQEIPFGNFQPKTGWGRVWVTD